MKYILRSLLIHLLALWFLIAINNGFQVKGDWQAVVYAALLLTSITLLVKPVLKILFLPINMITLGFFSWVINIVILYVLVRLTPQIHVEAWNFPGSSGPLVNIPAFSLPQAANFVVSALLLSFLIRILKWLAH